MTYTHRITITCPAEHTDAANQLALYLGESPADVSTFGAPSWQDAQGNTYSVCSFVCTAQWLAAATGTLLQSHAADLTMAQQAQELLVLNPEQASPAAIAYVVDADPLPALAALGLARIEVEEL